MRPELVHRIGIAQGPEPAIGHRFVQPEVVAAQHANVGVHERGDAGKVVLADGGAGLSEPADRLVQVQGVPQRHCVQNQPER